MEMNNNVILLFLVVIFFKNINSIIVLPFEMSRPNKESKENYSFNEFFYDNLFIDFYTTFYVGKDYTKVLGRISTFNHSFIFSEEECNRKSLKLPFDYSLVTKRGYSLYQSLTYKNISEKNNFLKISEIFNLFNTTQQSSIPPSLQNENFIKNSKLIDSKVTIYNMNIIKEGDNNIYNSKYCILVGLNSPDTSSNENVNFIKELKKLAIIDDYSWTLNFFSSGAGQLIIGGLPHEYFNTSRNFYQKAQYIKIKSSSVENYELPWSITFNQIYIMKGIEKIFLKNNEKVFLVPNLGFIIGTLEYKNLIYENYFKFFFEENICQIEKSNRINFFGNEIFEVFTCNATSYEKKKIFHNFPYLFFTQKDILNYTFLLNSFESFIKINDKYYFLIIFPENSNSAIQNWYLGFPFHKNYQFVFNYDSKTIGFYIDRTVYEEEELMPSKPIEIGDLKVNINLKKYSYKRIIFEIIICIILVIIAFLIGKKINKERKRKANELKDDNFEYFSSDINSDFKMNNNKNIKSNNKLLELSSKIS